MDQDRRSFIKSTAVAGFVASLPASATTSAEAAEVQPAAPHAGHEQIAQASPEVTRVYTFLNADEAAFIEAAVDTLIPADDLSPGGTDLGVAYYIDQQLGGAFGQGARMYMQGPFAVGVPEQGWQSPFTPAGIYRAAIPRVNQHCSAAYGRTFDQLDAARQQEVMRALEADSIDLVEMPGQTFFELLLQNTIEGFFADPAYGGNRDKLAWAMIGYPGVLASYADVIEAYHNRPYTEEPQSIADQI